MAKRVNRIPAIEHEQRQIEALKGTTPNTTPEDYRALSNGLADVVIVSLDIMGALETSNRPNFARLYDLIDGLADLVDEVAEGELVGDNADLTPAVAQSNSPQVVASIPIKSTVPINKMSMETGVSAVKTAIIGRPDRIETTKDTITLYMNYTPQPGVNGQYSFPKGVPAPAAISTSVIAYVGRKQFEKVKAQLDDPADALIIEGGVTQVINGVLTIYATNCTSKLLQAAKTAMPKATPISSEQSALVQVD